jgi:hypothetical protein
MNRARITALVAVLLALAAVWLWRGVESDAGRRAQTGGKAGTTEGFTTAPGTASVQAGALEGTVLHPDGTGATGAILAATLVDKSSRFRGVIQAPTNGRASSDGHFRIAALAPGTYEVAASVIRPVASVAVENPVQIRAGETTRVVLKLRAGGHRLYGRVVDSGGGPVAEAMVNARAVGRSPLLGDRGGMFGAFTDQEGRYELALPAGPYLVSARAGGYAPAVIHLQVMAQMKRDLRLDPGSRISGGVTTRASGQPVPEAEVTVTPVGVGAMVGAARTSTDGDGQFEVDGLQAGAYVVRARRGRLAASAQVRVGAGDQRTGLSLQADAGLSVAGTVFGLDGAPISGATILCTPGDEASARLAKAVAMATSTPSGSFSLEGVFPGEYQIAVHGTAYSPVRQQVRLIDKDASGLKFVITPQAAIVGRVLAASGAPVAGAGVTACLEQGAGSSWVGTYLTAITGDGGHFEFPRLEAGRISLRAQHDREGTATLDKQRIEPGTRKELVLKLEPGAGITGVVRSTDGRTVAGAAVVLRPSNPTPPWLVSETVADEGGGYAFRGLQGGTVSIAAARSAGVGAALGERTRGRERQVLLVAGQLQTGVDLTLPEAGKTLAGRVLTPEGQPAIGAIVLAGTGPHKPRGVDALRVSTDADGQFVFDDLEAEPLTLWAEHPQYAEASVEKVLPGSGTLVLRLLAGVALSGTVSAADGAAVADFQISLSPVSATGPRKPSGDVRVEMFHDPAGLFQMNGLAPGQYEVVAKTASGALGQATVVIESATRGATVRIKTAASAVVRGTIIDDETSAPVANVAVIAIALRAAKGSEVQATTDAAGAFSLAGVLTGGRVRLQFLSPDRGHLPDSETVDVEDRRAEVDVGTVRLIRGLWKAPPAASARFGLEHERRQDAVYISAVQPGTLAERQGFRPGERLVTIAGRDAAQLAQGARAYLLETTRPSLTLAIQGAYGASRTVTITR